MGTLVRMSPVEGQCAEGVLTKASGGKWFTMLFWHQTSITPEVGFTHSGIEIPQQYSMVSSYSAPGSARQWTALHKMNGVFPQMFTSISMECSHSQVFCAILLGCLVLGDWRRGLVSRVCGVIFLASLIPS